MNSRNMIRKSLMAATVILCLTFAVSTVAQVQTQSTTTAGPTTKTITIEHGEVVAVEGNNLFVKMPDGTLRDFPNVPASARVDVDGKQLSVHDSPARHETTTRNRSLNNAPCGHNHPDRHRQSLARDATAQSHSHTGK